VSVIKHLRCHFRENGNPEKTLLSHPEFISGSIKKMLKQVQHDKKSLDSRFHGNDIEYTLINPRNNATQE
jgi:hypothetical protein